jgi:predicted metallopeptidase
MAGENLVRLDIPIPDRQEGWLVAHGPTLKRARVAALWRHLLDRAARDRADWFARETRRKEKAA